MWLLVAGPIAAALAYAVSGIDWRAFAEAVERGGDNVIGSIESTSPNFAAVLTFVSIASAWSAVVAAFLYPVFQAMMLRWWTSGLRFGDMATMSRLRTGQMYGLYLRFMGYSLLFGIVISILAGFVFLIVQSVFKLAGDQFAEVGGIVAGVISYIAVMLGYSTIYQVIVKQRLWRLSFETADFSGLDALDSVKAAGAASSAFGEGLADALDVGGL
jgi:hypothetical protein